MAGNESKQVEGFGGWLILFQIRCYVSIAYAITLFTNPGALAANAIMALSIAAVLVLFYMRRIFFRTLYVIVNASAVLAFLPSLSAANVPVGMMIISVGLEAAVIAALYRSQRVKNTFEKAHPVAKAIDISAAVREAADPQPYDIGTAQMWTDDYISRQLLAVHLNPDTGLASRKPADIDSTVDWILCRFDKASAEILDLGCGPGLYAERFARAGHRVTGVDFSRTSIDYASQHAARHGLNIRYIQDNYLEHTFSEEFDLAVMIYCDFGVLNLRERSILMHNVCGALKPGGLFIFDAFNDGHIAPSLFGQRWEASEGGFWQAAPYICLSETRHFPEHRALLDQHIVINNDGRHKLYRFWNHYFHDSELDGAFRLAGFSGVTAHHGVANGEDITFFCAVK
jgi:2-polyprenyl-3-methyl-5-hydroxy-6-metoxy-1,4-benzoquinol methylase